MQLVLWQQQCVQTPDTGHPVDRSKASRSVRCTQQQASSEASRSQGPEETYNTASGWMGQRPADRCALTDHTRRTHRGTDTRHGRVRSSRVMSLKPPPPSTCGPSRVAWRPDGERERGRGRRSIGVVVPSRERPALIWQWHAPLRPSDPGIALQQLHHPGITAASQPAVPLTAAVALALPETSIYTSTEHTLRGCCS